MLELENKTAPGSRFQKIRRFIFCLAVGFVLGVIIAPAKVWLAGEILAVICLGLVFLIVYFSRRQRRLLYFFLGFVLVGAGVGIWRFQNYSVDMSPLRGHLGQDVQFDGVVVDSPDERDNSTRLTVRSTVTKEKILVVTSPYQRVDYGDLIRVAGLLSKPENFETDTGREFDYISYLKVRGINYQVASAKVQILESGHGFWLYQKLFQIKKAFLQKINEVIPEPQTSFLAGLLVGERRGLGEEINTAFRRTGLSHIVVLSGYNMTIVAEAIMIFLSYFLSFYLTLFFGAVGIGLFAVMVGGGATVVRASIMALLAIWARATGRVYSATLGLFIAGSLMVVINPLVLANDVGFQLSFLATLGLIYLSTPIEKRLGLISNKLGLRAIVATTIAAQIAVLPWLLYKIGEISIVALPANILVVPVVPLVMFLGFLTGLFGFVSVYLSLIFSYLTFILLSYALVVVDFFSSFPLATIQVPEIPWWVVGLLYLIMIFWFKYYLSTTEDKNDLKPF
ncbi:MAG: hypothetical protein QG665_450 [Patescibacteria group bacterium]|nr:hypothetical protein [Patescibacteria group bacterium]